MKQIIKRTLRKIGYDIIRVTHHSGRNPYADMANIVKNNKPMMFDVGANVGQTINELRKYFPNGTINAFEPNPIAFELLKQNVSALPRVHFWNSGLGSTTGQIPFFENSCTDMSSFLKLDEMGWGTEKKSFARITTIDQFCLEHKIDSIDILKIDTQGFELEVLKGAGTMISNNQIQLVYFEVIFSKMYERLPSFGDLYNFLTERGFKLVSIYDMHYQNNLASWTDLLFVHESYIKADKGK